MARKNSYFPVDGSFHQPIVFAASWAPNGSSAVASSSVLGSRFTVARTNTGVFTITFNDVFPDMIAASAQLIADVVPTSTSKLVSASISSYNKTNKTLIVTLADNTGTAVDVASSNNARVSVIAIFKGSVAKN